jgi:hypothetical protein
MRRAVLPGAEGDGPKGVAVVGYVPLLAGEPGRLLSASDEDLKRLMAEADGCPSGQAEEFLWLASHEVAEPIFVLERAAAIAPARRRRPSGSARSP